VVFSGKGAVMDAAVEDVTKKKDRPGAWGTERGDDLEDH
jgi:hypothetical protein